MLSDKFMLLQCDCRRGKKVLFAVVYVFYKQIDVSESKHLGIRLKIFELKVEIY